MGWSIVRLARWFVPFALPAVFVAACGNTGAPAATGEDGENPQQDYCGTPNEGCACAGEGIEVDCGQVKVQSGDFVSCSMGKRVCLAGKWGACNGTHLVTKNVPVTTIGTKALTQGPCPTTGPLSNPCDPYCHQVINDGGITIEGGSPATACEYYGPADPAASYAAIPAAYRANPAGACATGVADACGHDAWCPTGAGCQFFTGGQTNAAAIVDLTVSTPCLDGPTETVAICNRGTGNANTGLFEGVVQEFSLTGPPATASNVSMFKQGAPRGPGIQRGYCSIDLSANPISAGRCISRSLASLCPAADFTTGTGMRTIQFNVPDWNAGPTPPDPNIIATEGIRGNNFTVYAAGSLLACQGFNCGSAATATVQTTSTGLSSCGAGPNMGTNPPATICNAGNRYTVCQQDHRCNLATGLCEWNGGMGYFDGALAAGTIDLTMGAACETGGAEQIPVCNRGTGTLPPGTAINIHIGSPAPPADSCAPIGAPSCTDVAPATTGLGPGRCMNIACAIPGNKYGTVASPGESAGMCANNSAYLQTSGTPGCASCGVCDTRVSGKVYDPSSGLPAIANANNLPLAGIGVYEPAGALTTFVDGVQCDTCASLESPSIVRAVTDSEGTFTMSGVTPGPNRRIVVQSGRWRRETFMNVTACANNAAPVGALRMPRNRTDFPAGGSANIPKMAVLLQGDESVECMIHKLGISASEFGPVASTADPRRLHFYQSNGLITTPAAQSATVLYNSAANINAYTAIVSACSGISPSDNDARFVRPSLADATRLRDYVNAGGRMFLDHWSGHDVIKNGPAPMPSTATWLNGASLSSGAKARVNTASFPQQLLRDWLVFNGVSTTFGPGFVNLNTPRSDIASVNAPAIEWMRGSNTNLAGWTGAGNISYGYSFETPFGAPTTCGRVLHNSMHVSEPRDGSGTPRGSYSNPATRKSFPASCVLNLALTEEELALTYQLFQLTACQLGGEPPPPPPAPLPATTVSVDFEGLCPVGHIPEWQFFYWQSQTPPGTSMVFRAATADTQAALPPNPPPAPPPGSVPIGTATGGAIVDPNWQSDPNTVSYHLSNDPPGSQPSKQWLRVYVTLNPIGAVPPVLTSWRQDYSCKPAE